MTDSLRLGLTLGMILSPLAGLTAFLITYEEYQHHFPRGRAIRAGLGAGALTFAVFLMSSVATAILVVKAAH